MQTTYAGIEIRMHEHVIAWAAPDALDWEGGHYSSYDYKWLSL